MILRPAIVALTCLAASALPALAEKRVALVIGNSAYQNVTPLTNPTNDASAMTATLKRADRLSATAEDAGLSKKGCRIDSASGGNLGGKGTQTEVCN